MQFKLKELKDFLSSINKHKVKKIQIESQHLKLTINKDKIIQKKEIISIKKTQPEKITQSKLQINKEKIDNHKIHEVNTYFTIISPMIGTFYRSPAPNEPSFIKINDLVQVNQTVCIIEAMKLMNEIESEVNGQVVEILVQDGDIVDCGQALMRVKHK